MRCVESGVQSGRYLAPMSRAFSLSSPLKGFWKPLRTNTTPSIIRLNGTCCTLGFGCLGLGLDWLSRFLSADFCPGAAGETICASQGTFPGKEIIFKIHMLMWELPFALLGLGVLAGLGLCLGVTALPSGEPAGLIFFEGGGPGEALLNSNFLFAGGYEETISVSHSKIGTFSEWKHNVHLYIKTGALEEILLDDK